MHQLHTNGFSRGACASAHMCEFWLLEIVKPTSVTILSF